MSNNIIEFKKIDRFSENSILEVEEKNDLNDFKIEKEMNFNQDMFYGNPSSKKNPRKIGNTFAFMYKNGDPRILIGPHCNFSLI